MAIAPRTPNYTLGAGKLYFDRQDADGSSTGEFYIGNTTALSSTTAETRQEHYTSDYASRAKDASVVTQSDVTLGFTTDDINPFNLALLWKGDASILSVMAIPSTITIQTVNRGRWYQLGVTDASPTGARAVTITSVTTSATTPVALDADSWEADTQRGRIFISDTATDVEDGDQVTITWTAEAHSRDMVIASGESIRGSMRYIADNTTGINRDDFWPLVDLSPDGDFDFKADSWTSMSFTGEVLAAPGLAKHYVDGLPVTA